MTRLGSDTHKQDAARFYGPNGDYNQFARRLTLPSGGPWVIRELGVWAAAVGGDCNARLVIWDYDSGAVIAQSAEFTLQSHAFALGASDKYEKTISGTDPTIAGSTKVLVGVAVNDLDGVQYDYESGVTVYERLRATWPGSMSGYDTESGAIQAWLTYETANTLPDAPTLGLPASGSRQITATPTFTFTHNDDDNDACASYDIQVDNNSDFSSPLWDGTNLTSGIVGDAISVVYAGSALTPGTLYYWRARTNDGTGDGTWSSSRTFRYNAKPTITKNAPTASALAVIHNIDDLNVWSGSEAKPQVKFTPSDADGDSLTKYRIRIYNDSAGTEGDGDQVYDSGEVSLAMVSGVLQTVNVNFGIANGTERWWTVKVYDGYEWGDESTRTAFKMRWAQGIYTFDTGAANTTNWVVATGTVAETVQLLFRNASTSGGATPSAWSTTPTPGQRYAQVLVRMTTDTAGTSATLASLTFSYYGTPSTPDGWVVS